jgi:hypothetical protein
MRGKEPIALGILSQSNQQARTVCFETVSTSLIIASHLSLNQHHEKVYPGEHIGIVPREL